MPQLTILKRPVFYLDQGAGEAIVMLHAGASSGRQWTKTAALLENDFRVVVPDLWDCGQTGAWQGEEPPSHDDQAQLVEALIEELGVAPSHVVGHSYGGASAVRLALRRPDLMRSLVLIEPILMPLLELSSEPRLFSEYFEMAQAFGRHAGAGNAEAAWQEFVDYRGESGTWARLPPQVRERLLRETRSAARAFRSNLGNPTTLEDLRGIRIRTLVLCGENTTPADRRVTEIVRDRIPDCGYAIVPGADHMSPLSHPRFIADAVREHARNETTGSA